MTIFDAAPAIVGLVMATAAYTICRFEHDRVMAEVRREREERTIRQPVAAE